MKVLVSGGAGFIGSHICERLVNEGHEVVCVDNLDGYYSPEVKRRNIGSFDGDFTFIEGDIRDGVFLKGLVDGESPEYVIHEAAQAGVRASVADPLKTCEVNIQGTINVLEAVKESNVRKLVFASSSSVYGRIEYLPFDEEHPKNPISQYGASKLACEHYLRLYERFYGIKHTSLRYFTVYGPRIRPDLAIHKFARTALTGGRLELYGDGSKSRDFTYVSDAVDATLKALKKGGEVYNVGGGARVTVKELAEKIIELAGGGTISYIKDQMGDVMHTESNTEKARRELCWNPVKDFEEGLRETVEWVRSVNL
ncbi:MAG: NAD-dependent epimerase/dehydratase family protein [Candidatus Altiarchaeales archaeon]|nr:NAD-dependent epimerase/dehydratase family protein [Candidatus Altiarchaeales archaeon]MBD3415651.1 NAD-dependent epimerase/dehydratase family protein [Candidatus Altiarchaeales archaeon]